MTSEVMEAHNETNKHLIPSSLRSSVRQSFNFLKDYFAKFGVEGLRREEAVEYLRQFDDLLIFGEADKHRIAKRMK